MKQIDVSIVLSSFACLFILFGLLAYRPQIQIVEQTVQSTPIPMFNYVLPLPKITRTETKEEYTADLEEHSEYTALFYATEPIGRYYITAYNHEETGSKQTASGAICHEGTITTCAADVPKYFHFGDYIEVGGRIYRVEDTGSAVKKKHIDLYFASYKAMARYGSHYETIYRVEFPFGKPAD